MIERSFGGTLASFKLLGVPVQVEASFLVTSLIMGSSLLRTPAWFLVWTAIVFVSILIHELGHALVGRRFGLVPEVRLYAWGGLTSFPGGRSISWSRSLAISLAGPAVGLVVGAAAWLFERRVPGQSLELKRLLDQVIFVNGIWGLVNLAPLLPLDGGQALQAVLSAIAPARAEQGARLVSAVTGFTLGAIALAAGWTMSGVFAIWLGVDAARRLDEARREGRDEELIARLQPIFSAQLEAKDGAALIATAEPALAEARTDRARLWLLENLALGHTLLGDIDAAVAALSRAPLDRTPGADIEGFIVWSAVKLRKHTLAEAEGFDVDMAVRAVPARGDDDASTWEVAARLLHAPDPEEIDALTFARIREAGEILGRDREAAQAGEILLDRAPDPDLAFALCCVLARADEESAAASCATQAVSLGFRDRERAAAHPSLARPAGREARRILTL